jgi:hypothetical protein
MKGKVIRRFKKISSVVLDGRLGFSGLDGFSRKVWIKTDVQKNTGLF